MALFPKKEKDTSIENDMISGSINMIGVGTVIDGDITCKGDIRLDGSIKGNINSKAKVVIGLTGSQEGVITCQNADISGYLNGNISVGETLFLKSNARVHGDIMTNKLVVEAGAVFTGNCNMGAVSEKSRKDKEHNLRDNKSSRETQEALA